VDGIFHAPTKAKSFAKVFAHSHQLKTATERSSFEVELWCSNKLSKLGNVGGVGRIVRLKGAK